MKEKIPFTFSAPSQFVPGPYLRAGFMFSMASKDHKQIGPLSTCKAYIQDDLHHRICGHEGVYSYAKDIDLEAFRICVVYSGEHAANFFTLALDLISSVEEELGFKQTEMTEVIMPNNEFIGTGVEFVADKRWMMALPMVSLYTLLVRLAPMHELGRSWEETLDIVNKAEGKTIYETGNPFLSYSDRDYLQKGIKVIKNIVKITPYIYFSRKIEKNYNANSPGSHSCGIASLGTRSTDYCKNFFAPRINTILQKLKAKNKPVEI